MTVPADCEAFVITGICGLAGTAALRVGLRVRKRSGKRVLGAAAGTRSRRAPGHRAARLRTRTLFSGTPKQCARCHNHTNRIEAYGMGMHWWYGWCAQRDGAAAGWPEVSSAEPR